MELNKIPYLAGDEKMKFLYHQVYEDLQEFCDASHPSDDFRERCLFRGYKLLELTSNTSGIGFKDSTKYNLSVVDGELSVEVINV